MHVVRRLLERAEDRPTGVGPRAHRLDVRARTRSLAICGATFLTVTIGAPAHATPASGDLYPGGHRVAASPVALVDDALRFRGHSMTRTVEQGLTELKLQRQLTGDVLLGDWNGDGVATPAAFLDGRWQLHNQLDAADEPELFFFGRAGDVPLAGDWNGDGQHTVAVRRGARFFISDAARRTAYDFYLGQASDLPLAGDFNGDGRDTVGVWREATFYLSNGLRGGSADIVTTFGRASDLPVIGDWNGSGQDTVGVRRGTRFFLSDDNRLAAHEFSFGSSADAVRIWPGARPHEGCPTAAFSPESTHGEIALQVRPPAFGAVTDGDADLDRALQTANRYLLNAHWEQRWQDRPRSRDFYDLIGSGLGRTEHSIRPPGMEAASLAISLRTGYDEDQTGRPVNAASAHAADLIRSVACQHKSVTMGGWGDQWQSAYWAKFAGLAAWLLWDEIAVEDRFYIARMLEHEADRLVDLPVRYWRDARGLGPRNSHAEVLSWDSSLVALAAAMMPDHPRRGAWQRTAVQYSISAAAMPQDAQRQELLNGQAVRAWVDGYNVTHDGLVYNHDRISPDYSTAMHAGWSGGLFHTLAGQPTPRAYFHNAEYLYGALATRPFATGTVYVPGSSDISYPEGSSWSTIQRAQFANFDAMAYVFGVDGRSTVSGLEWQRLHTAGQLGLQARHADGRTYTGAIEHRYPGREELTAQLLAFARLTEHIGALGLFSLDDTDYADASVEDPAEGTGKTEPVSPSPPRWLATVVPLSGDVHADGRSDLGWWSAGAWALTTKDHFTYRLHYGRSDDEPLLGDWNGDGRTTVGIRRGNTFHLSNRAAGGPADYSFRYGRVGDEVLVGDWNGDGRDTIGLRRGATFYLSNEPRGGNADVTFAYGRVDDQPLAGDWNGDGRSTPGIKRGSTYYLSNRLRGGPADYSFRYGRPDDHPLSGDFNGNGQDTISVVRGGTFYINDHPRGGTATSVVTPPRP